MAFLKKRETLLNLGFAESLSSKVSLHRLVKTVYFIKRNSKERCIFLSKDFQQNSVQSLEERLLSSFGNRF